MGVGEEAGAHDGSPEGLRASNVATFALQTQSSSSSLENALERGETGDRDQEDSYCMTKRQGGECGGGKMGKEGGSLGRPALSAGRDQPLPGPDSLSAVSPGCRLSRPRKPRWGPGPKHSSSDSEGPHPAETHAWGLPSPCLLGASGHSASDGAIFPTTQETISHLGPSDRDTNTHNSCLCWWRRHGEGCLPVLRASGVPEFLSPLKKELRISLSAPGCTEPLRTGLSGQPSPPPQAGRVGATVDQPVTVTCSGPVEMCCSLAGSRGVSWRTASDPVPPPTTTATSTAHM